MTRIALEVQRTKVIHSPDEVVSITLGRDLSRLMPSEASVASMIGR